jgi:hypothetical protein
VPAQAGTLEVLSRGIARILEPLSEELDPSRVLAFFGRLGVQFPETLLTGNPQLVSALNTASESARGFPAAVDQLDDAIADGDTNQILAATVDVVGRIVAFSASLVAVKDRVVAAPPPAGVTAQQKHDFANDLPRAILDYAIVRTGEVLLPEVTGILALVGLIDRVPVAGDPGNPTKPDYTKRRLRLDRLGKFFSNPLGYAGDLVGWGPAFTPLALLQRVQDFHDSFAIPSTLTNAPPRFESYAFDLAAAAGSPPGVAFEIHVPITAGIELTVPWCSGFAFHLLTEASADTTIDGSVRHPAVIEATAAADISGRALVGLSLNAVAPATAIILIGQTGGSRIEVAGVRADAGVRFRWNSSSGTATVEPDVQGTIRGAKVVIDTSQADGFIGTLTSGLKVEGGFDARLGWAPSTGIRFEGSATIEIQIPLHVSLGPIDISSLYLVAGLAGSDSGVAIPLELSVGLGAKLGPLEAAVERIGAKGNLTFPDNGGNLGPANLSIEFKPPNGIGLAVDAGVVKGGGYLYIDTERGEYAGALELTFSGFLSLKAIGIITTKNPDGSPGFSLLILITAEFETGIQLGFGFALFAVGGLLGLNRTMKLQALMEGVRSGALNSIMFPQNVIANAPKIISDLRTVFPPQQGTFLIGPMAKLGWGTPPLISVALGIIIEIPGNIAILGVLKVALPTEKAPVLIIQVNFAGAIEFDRKRLYFFAALFESRVLFITIEGEMGLLVAFGDDANFVVSVGGFHPRFSPPPLPFPSPIRVALNLINESWARVRVEGYFAVTSNSVQFGAAVQVFIGVSAFNVSGHLAFDALFQFSPFYFIITISASFSVKVFGAGLFSVRFSGSLEGPTPWRVAGEGSISILFFDISVDFEVTWGETNKATLPPIEVLPLIRAELNKPESWRALPPVGNNLLVSLRKMPAEEAALVLHPVGVLRVSQRAVPLALTLGKVGNQKPSDVNRLTIAVAGGGLAQKAEAFEQFAPAQFQEMSDAEKLSRPAFSKERSGLELSAAGEDLRTGGMTRRVVRYEEIILDSNFKRFIFRFRLLGSLLFNFFLGSAAVARSELSLATKKKYQPFADKIEVKDATYTVAFQSNNQAYSPAAATFTSEASAQEFLRGEAAKDGNLTETLHVIPSWERAA